MKKLNNIKATGIIQDYAIGGGYAVMFYDLPYATYDLDVFVVIPPSSSFTKLSKLYDYFLAEGAKIKNEHIIIGDLPVQFLSNDISPLVDDSIRTAHDVDFEGTKGRFVRVENLILLLLTAFRPKDRIRVPGLINKADKGLLISLIERFDDEKNKLHEKYERILGEARKSPDRS